MNSPRKTRRSRTSNQLIVFVAFVLLVVQNATAEEQRVVRVAADPNNLPFSNDRLEGFENKIAELIARELHCKIEYHWRAQRRGFFRETLKSGDVDLVMGVPAYFDMALTTAPYYRSSYVFVSRADRNSPHPYRNDDVRAAEERRRHAEDQALGIAQRDVDDARQSDEDRVTRMPVHDRCA